MSKSLLTLRILLSKFSSCCLHLILLNVFICVDWGNKSRTTTRVIWISCRFFHFNVNDNYNMPRDNYVLTKLDFRRRNTNWHVIWISENKFAYYKWYLKTAYPSWIPVNPISKAFIYVVIYIQNSVDVSKRI